ncbi:MAG TPA: hypothetical protein VGS01_14735 [Candidatus Limnocylindria bacterium]|jgi:hypothetical protein|nr:hypothetical protein [Candidatus Limnocylindria bacterium]
MTRLIPLVAAALVVVSSFAIYGGTAAAHERRMVGPYQFVVGWLNEPAYVGVMNSLDLHVTDTRITPAKAVEGLEKTLTADVQSGGLSALPLAVTARFGTAGAYNGYVMPTATGTYIFHIKGKVESLDVDEKFESGPGRFGDIEPTTALQYPNKVPAADELGKRLGDLQSGVDQTRLLSGVAVVIGILALGVSIAMSRRRA